MGHIRDELRPEPLAHDRSSFGYAVYCDRCGAWAEPGEPLWKLQQQAEEEGRRGCLYGCLCAFSGLFAPHEFSEKCLACGHEWDEPKVDLYDHNPRGYTMADIPEGYMRYYTVWESENDRKHREYTGHY